MAIYQLSDELDLERFRKRAQSLIKRGARVELTEPQAKRTNPQNNLIHMWFALIASEVGSSPEDIKIEIKRLYRGQEEYISPITGEVYLRDWSTASLSKDEMTEFITWFRAWGDEQGFYLPTEEDRGFESLAQRYGY